MTLALEQKIPLLSEDATGAIRVGNTRVLLELVIRSFQDGASPESIVGPSFPVASNPQSVYWSAIALSTDQ